MLIVEKVTRESQLQELAPEWDALEARLAPRVPFRSAHWNLLWWKHFRQTGDKVRDELRSYVVRDAQGRLVAVAPMMLTRRPGAGIALTRELQFLGADSNMTELRGLVCRDEDQPQVIEALLSQFRSEKRDWDWVQWSGVNAAAVPALGHRGFISWRHPTPDFFLRLPASWDEFRGGLSRNIKESLRKCYNSLKRDGHEFTFKALSAVEEMPAALDRFYALHSARAEMDTAIRHGNVFAHERARHFLLDYCSHLAQRQGVRVFQLEIAGQIVATRIGFVIDQDVFFYYSGYLPEWGRYSVMTTLVAEMIRWAIAQGFKTVNLSTGRDVSKTRWGPEEIDYVNGLQSAPNWFSQFWLRSYSYLYEQSRKDRPLAKLVERLRR